MNERKKRLFIVGLIVLSAIPAVLLMHMPASYTTKAIALYLSAIFGYLGMVLLLWEYILGSKSIIGLWLRDIAPVIKIHSFLGKYGTLGILLHPILVTFAYSESWWYSFIPKVSTHAESHVTLGRISMFLLLIIWVTSALVRGNIKYRPWKYIHYLAYIVLPFAFLHVPDLGSQYMSHLEVKLYLYGLGLIYVYVSFLRLRSFLNLDKAPYIVLRQKEIAKGTLALQLRPTEFQVAPERGQFVYIKFGLISEDHPFTVTQHNDSTGEITVTYRVYGTYTDSMRKLQPGQTVWLGGPYGSFMNEDEFSEKPRVFIAGGIGITPFIDEILRPRDNQEQWLFYANRHLETAPYVPQLESALGSHLVETYSRTEEGRGHPPHERYIDEALLARHLDDPTRFNYYICGTPALIATMRTAIESLGVSHRAIYSEEFGW